jgi:hypothetical protein
LLLKPLLQDKRIEVQYPGGEKKTATVNLRCSGDEWISILDRDDLRVVFGIHESYDIHTQDSGLIVISVEESNWDEGRKETIKERKILLTIKILSE